MLKQAMNEKMGHKNVFFTVFLVTASIMFCHHCKCLRYNGPRTFEANVLVVPPDKWRGPQINEFCLSFDWGSK